MSEEKTDATAPRWLQVGYDFYRNGELVSVLGLAAYLNVIETDLAEAKRLLRARCSLCTKGEPHEEWSCRLWAEERAFLNPVAEPTPNVVMRCKFLKEGETMCQLPNVHCRAPDCMEPRPAEPAKGEEEGTAVG